MFLYWNIVLVSSVTILISAILCTKALNYHCVVLGEAVSLDCPGEHGDINKWEHGGVNIYYNNLLIDRSVEDNISILFENYSLLIQEISIEHDGFYQCLRDSKVVSEHYVEVKGLYLHFPWPFHCDTSNVVTNALYWNHKVYHNGKLYQNRFLLFDIFLSPI